ncbi:MAG: hypothetical protein H0S80_14615 [Desulfovibrionaceae bacterium]|nr:hypothetical protein [Desulfovibrionaceae bacterium]
MDEPNDTMYQNYIDNRKNYDELETGQQGSLDKHMLALSSASLAFSIALIEKVVPFHQAQCLFVLIVGWVLFGVSIFCTISSFYASVLTCRDYRQQMDDNFRKGVSGASPLVSKWEKQIDWCNKGAYFAFVFGLVCLLLFSIINVGST